MKAKQDLTYAERQERIAAESADWDERYAVVRELSALGFVADAYGNVNGPTILCPPGKFLYPRGGLAHPHMYGGTELGSRFGIWNHECASPDELRDKPVWAGPDVSGYSFSAGPIRYRARWGMTLAEAVAYCIACAEHHLQRSIVPTWEQGYAVLPARLWREVLDAETEPPAAGQLALFAPLEPPSPRQRTCVTIAESMAGRGDEELVRVPDRSLDVELLIGQANWRRDADAPGHVWEPGALGVAGWRRDGDQI